MLDKKNTLVFLHPHFTIPGGAGHVALEYAQILSKKINVVIITQQVNAYYYSKYPSLKFISLNGPLTSSMYFWLLFPYWTYRTFLAINQYRSSPVCIFPQVFPSTWIAAIYKIFNPKIPLVAFCHEPTAFIHIPEWQNAINPTWKRIVTKSIAPILKPLDIYLINKCNRIFVNSKFGQTPIKKTYKHESFVIYPGVNQDKFYPNTKSKNNVIITIGRLTKFKNIDLIIKSMTNIDSSINLNIIGEGEEKDNLIGLTNDLKLKNRVKFLGNLDEQKLIKELQSAFAIIHAAKKEPFGIVLAEAQACGTPAIADNSGGPQEIIIHNKTGLLIDISTKNIAKAVNYLIQNPAKVKLMSIKAPVHILNNFTWDKGAQKIIKKLIFS